MLIIGISGTELLAQEREWLKHPAVAGVILFTRNFSSREQVIGLIQELRAACPRSMLVCVDQEGGRVQRFKDGFFALPALQRVGAMDDATSLAREHGWLMASEMREIGIDLSFAPVVDLGRGNRAIGDRALHQLPSAVAELAEAYIGGMHQAGMAATLKHFPGHGSVLEDTHFDAAVDPRPLDQLMNEDLLPFLRGMQAGAEAVMMAHVSYPAVAEEPAGYSRRWIQDVLRKQLGFDGVVISDDIGMAAAESAGGIAARLKAHFDAGCDLVLVCPPALVAESLAAMPPEATVNLHVVSALQGRAEGSDTALVAKRQAMARQQLASLNDTQGSLA
ncbi:beta-N-acetylhexosaminidase [Pseudomarimonas arenosa]|uniref:Beta-hexosaminidase n=1 Tax=Pseudomarimonas arenosa TaxID=2774145 RepID=A0AAW3ZFI7_9GAMM|nr:beta-N-acetylhexosaminidase [Pseudomarimonas arenosa]MBD8524821.1 beta-N-acetylhexosaminidase [Pseudomarimonas arenosa]